MAISVSVGVTMYPEDGADFGTLLRKADMAMYRAKDAGRNSYRFFNEEMNDAVIEQATLHAGLRRVGWRPASSRSTTSRKSKSPPAGWSAPRR